MSKHLRAVLDRDIELAYAGATLLGRILIGVRSTLGGNVWLTESGRRHVIHQGRSELAQINAPQAVRPQRSPIRQS